MDSLRSNSWLTLTCFFFAISILGVPQLNAQPQYAHSTDTEMVLINGGSFTPLFSTGQDAKISVRPFYLDVHAVTNKQFYEFVRENLKWQKSQVSKIFAESSYLQEWEGDDSQAMPKVSDLSRPVTSVSWFAAKNYCKWKEKRLPTVAEWEFVGLANETMVDARQEPKYSELITNWYAQPKAATIPSVKSGQRNVWGVYDMHGVIWEWASDFNSAIVTGESRGDADLERNLFCGAGSIGVSEKERINYPAFLRYAFRSSLQGNYTVRNLGFRCAKDFQ